jgi:hypothetical protein
MELTRLNLKLLKRKLLTLRKNPKEVACKYINKARRYLLLSNPEIPMTGEDYFKHWKADFQGKCVLDLGADYGSTACYFLRRGAREVIAVEGNRILALNLARNAKRERRITPIQGMITRPEQVDALILKYKPDIVKVDIEGCESALFGSHFLSLVKE